MRGAGPLLLALLALAAAPAIARLADLTRRDSGDTFTLFGESCGAARCAEHGAGASADGEQTGTSCKCSCPLRAPLFREDRELCVDDLPECSLATFGGGGASGAVQRIPFVYLPLNGQIIHPSKEITFPGVKTPICAVSGAQYLTRKGLAELRNSLDADVPFSLFRDEGRTFLQWVGEESMRTRMSGRVMLVRLLCRDVTATPAAPLDLRGVFTPCVAFRVQGSPGSLLPNVSEVQFAPNAHISEAVSTSGLTVSEYVAICISSLLLGLIYVASVFLYLHIRKKRRTASETEIRRCVKGITKKDGTAITEHDIVRISNERVQTLSNAMEHIDDIVIKKNPLLGMGRHFHDIKNSLPSDSGSNVSDSEDFPDSSGLSDDNRYNTQVTSAVVHPTRRESMLCNESMRSAEHSAQTESGIERLPHEHVSIVETQDDSSTITRPVGTTRRKLYFNPAYFEPHLMAEPPPAAIEFLAKIREVITIAKHKMAAKRFQPVLNEIPEEETYPSAGNSIDLYQGLGSQRSGSVVSLKRENSRKRSLGCVGCPGCKLDGSEFSNFVNYDIPTCSNCMNRKGDKQTIIRKWLENIPLVKQQTCYSDVVGTRQNNSLVNSLLSLPAVDYKPKIKKQNSFNMPHHSRHENAKTVQKKSSTLSVRSEPAIRSYNLPLPEFNNIESVPKNYRDYGQTISRTNDIRPIGLSNYRPNGIGHSFSNALPDMINEAIALEHCSKSCIHNSCDEERIYNKVPKILTATVRPFSESPPANDYETDSLERTSNKKGSSTPTEYTEVPSSQASPSLSTALPLEEELTMQNAIYKNTNSTIKSNTPSPNRDIIDKNHYETIGRKDTSVKKEFDRALKSPKDEYSLVSEVYVNNNYNFGSAPTSPSGSECSMGSRKLNKNTQNDEEHKPGSLMIEVKDCPDNYIKIHESDDFEPDTLDRKHPKHKEILESIQFSRKDFIQQLNNEEKTHVSQIIQLRSSGTFKRDTNSNTINKENKFNSLRHIYEHHNNTFIRPKLADNLFRGSKSLEDNLDQDSEVSIDWNSEEGRILTLELRHSKRQRQCTPPTIKQLKSLARPDVLPPLPPTDSIYEQPSCPPRRVEVQNIVQDTDPKNANGRSLSPRIFVNNKIINKTHSKHFAYTGPSCSPTRASVQSHNSDYENITTTETTEPNKFGTNLLSHRRRSTKVNRPELERMSYRNNSINTNTYIKGYKGDNSKRVRRVKGSHIEDSGYLSSDSTSSQQTPRKIVVSKIVSCSESDDTENEARSESGAESVETHSVFFGSVRNFRKNELNSSFGRKCNFKRHSNRETKLPKQFI